MFPDDRPEHEPEEPDRGPEIPRIELEEGDPELGPEVPSVSLSDDGFFGPDDAPKELMNAFWRLVVVFNVGILAASLGVLFLVFGGPLLLGGGLLAVGVFALARGLYRYRTLDIEGLDTDSD